MGRKVCQEERTDYFVLDRILPSVQLFKHEDRNGFTQMADDGGADLTGCGQ